MIRLKKIQNKFLKRKRIINILEDNINSKIIFISAPIGCGKTVAVKQLEEDMKCEFIWIDFATIKSLELNKYKDCYIVLENFDKIKTEFKEVIINYLEKNSKKVIINSRKQVDPLLNSLFYSGKLIKLDKSDLNFNKDEVREFLELNRVIVSLTELNSICEDIKGYAIIINILVDSLKKESYSKKMYDTMKRYLFNYIEVNIFDKIDNYLMDFIMKTSCINKICENSVKYILNIQNSVEMLKKAENSGSFLEQDDSGEYIYIPVVREYLMKKLQEKVSKDVIYNIYIKAAKYYQDIEINLIYSSEYYILAGKYDIAACNLTKESIHHLGIINYKELEKYILKIPLEVINKYPSLYISLAHIYMLNDKELDAKKWYKKFKVAKENFRNDIEAYSKLQQMDLYYQICLPDTNDIKLVNYFKVLSHIIKGDSILNSITFTGNQPSILSGGKDLSEWGRHYKMAYMVLNPIVKSIFKENQYGSGEIGIAEVLYQNNKIDEAIEYVTKGIALSNNIDNLFVAYCLLDKIGLAKNERNYIIDAFYKKIEKENAWHLKSNYEARLIENNILFGNNQVVIDWLKRSNIDIIDNFNILEKYRYLVFAKACIQVGKYTDALIILERFNKYIDKYHRRMYKIEYHILKSICLYKQNQKQRAFENIKIAIIMGNKFNYVRVFADEGSIIYTILKEFQNSNIDVNKILNSKYFNEILKESQIYGKMYPEKYIQANKINIKDLTKKEIEILELIKMGKSNKEICEELNVTLSTIKTHINHIYSKLDTKNRIQTINKANEIY